MHSVLFETVIQITGDSTEDVDPLFRPLEPINFTGTPFHESVLFEQVLREMAKIKVSKFINWITTQLSEIFSGNAGNSNYKGKERIIKDLWIDETDKSDDIINKRKRLINSIFEDKLDQASMFQYGLILENDISGIVDITMDDIIDQIHKLYCQKFNTDFSHDIVDDLLKTTISNSIEKAKTHLNKNLENH